MVPVIILLLSIIIDGVLTNFLPYLVNNLSYFTPLFTVTSIFLIYPFYRKNKRLYFITLFITGFIYDLFYTNLLFYNGVLFVIIGLITYLLYKNFEVNFFKLIIYIILIIISYESINALLLLIYNVVPITTSKIVYKISHSLIINVIYGEIVYLIIKKLPKKYKQISIN